MKHADEGQLHAYLDGELSPAEVTELERHLSVCAPCRALLNEARSFLAESDALVLALDVPVVPKPMRRPRRVPYSTLGWAAMVVLALGTGYALRPALGPKAAANVIGEQAAPIVATVPAEPTAETHPAPFTRRQERRAAPAAAKAVDAPPPAAATGPAAGAGASNQAVGALAQAERTDELSRDAAPAAPVPAPAAVAQTPSRLTYIDGTPVDTSATRLSFGPRSSAAPRRITLDEAVTHLGGSIRLIDGLAPQRVEILAGVDVAGADPDREVIRVYYEEPDLGLVTLDQQRPGPSFAARDARAREAQSDIAPARVNVDPAPQPAASGMAMLRGAVPVNNVTWRTDGVWLSLSSKLTGPALAQLQARVK
ncbi:MAG TPA: zf-HC2 domain-containing protein [Gemmatimonadales bacterium]|nr:zf-HC2 domain-containing protein [Gemmatimonadales bacterium]